MTHPRLAQRRTDRLDRLIPVLARLDAPARSVPDLLQAVPDLVCELGFDRASISRIRDEASQLQVGEPIRHLHPVLITGPKSYVAAPIISGGQQIGLIQADCRRSARELGEVDRDVLAAFAVGLRMALAGCVLHEQLLGTRYRVTQLTWDLRSAPGEIDRMPSVPPSQAISSVARDPQVAASERLPDSLTGRELEVLGLLAAGSSNAAIGQRLMIAEATAKAHVLHVFRKLGVNNRSEAVARWFRAGESGNAPHYSRLRGVATSTES